MNAVVNALVYALVNAVVTAPRIYSVLQIITFLAVIVAWMIFNYHQINSSSLATGTQPMFAIWVAYFAKNCIPCSKCCMNPIQ